MPLKSSRTWLDSSSAPGMCGWAEHTTAAPSRSFTAPARRTHLGSANFVLDAGEPAVLVGTDTGPNPAEALLHALAACLTTSLVYVASARGVRLTRVESTLEGDMDVRGALGLSDDYRNGFEQVRVSFRVKGDAPEEKLRQILT